jgi:hypothetical protein
VAVRGTGIPDDPEWSRTRTHRPAKHQAGPGRSWPKRFTGPSDTPATLEGVVQRSLANVPTARLLREHAKALCSALVVYPNVVCGWGLVRVVVVLACMKTGPPV